MLQISQNASPSPQNSLLITITVVNWMCLMNVILLLAIFKKVILMVNVCIYWIASSNISWIPLFVLLLFFVLMLWRSVGLFLLIISFCHQKPPVINIAHICWTPQWYPSFSAHIQCFLVEKTLAYHFSIHKSYYITTNLKWMKLTTHSKMLNHNETIRVTKTSQLAFLPLQNSVSLKHHACGFS